MARSAGVVRRFEGPVAPGRVWLLLTATVFAGCASVGSTGRPPVVLADRPIDDAPAAFDPVPATLRLAGADTLAGDGCLNPLVDPRDGRRLTLVRSWVTEADYQAPADAYGLRPGELLRLACNTGRPMGVVRR